MSIIPSFFGQRSSILDPLSLDVLDPFHNLQSLTDSGAFFGDRGETSAFVNTQIDWKETADEHIFKADLPGLKREEVKVEIEEGKVLQIRGDRSKVVEEKNDRWHRVERSRGKFLRRFRLPEDANVEQVKAAMENGVLMVTVPKEAPKKPDIKSIQISG